MANGIAPLTRLPAWQALETHYSKIRRVHLRKLFADDVKRGESMATEAVGIYFDYNWRWAGVPFYIRTGKCLPVNCTEVLVELKAPPCSSFSEKMEWPNYVRLRLGPDVAIAVGVRSKARGEAMACQEVELLATQGISGEEEMDAYERLLGDAMKGDATLFAREDVVEAEWRIVAPILANASPPHEYETGTWGPAEADRLIDRAGGWHQPQPAPPRRSS